MFHNQEIDMNVLLNPMVLLLMLALGTLLLMLALPLYRRELVRKAMRPATKARLTAARAAIDKELAATYRPRLVRNGPPRPPTRWSHEAHQRLHA